MSDHTGLLWALETIAWEPAYFERAVMLLARLAAIDPGGSLANRPLNSLGEIFLPWHPSTEAGPELRLAALDQICKTLPDVGWKVIQKMLPTMHGVASGTSRPKLREAGSGETTLTYEQYWSTQSVAIQRAVTHADLNPERWQTLVVGVTNFAPADREITVKALSDALPMFSDRDRKSVWEALLNEVEKHERFADAKWALPKEQLAPLRALVDKYAPEDPVEQTRLLFDSWSFDSSGDREPINKVRWEQLSRLLRASGPKAIADLAAQVQNSYEVVDALGHIDIQRDRLEAIASYGVSAEPTGFVIGLVATIANRFGIPAAQDWLIETRKEAGLSNAAIARLCQGLIDNRATWAFVRSLGTDVEAAYWSTKGPFWLKGEKDELLEAVDRYLRFGRGIAALEVSLQRLGDVPTGTLFAILEVIVREVTTGTQRDPTMISYETQKAFEELGRRADASIDELARHEISMFPLLEHSEYKMRVFEVLASNPNVYFDILKEVFRAEDEPESQEEASESQRSIWRLNYSILSNFHLIPGQSPEGIDEVVLTRWIEQVRQLAVEGKRVKIADQYIGHILAHSADGADGAWPAEPIRAQLERVRSDEMERGIMVERFNMRGAHFRSLYGGGDEERGFAAQFDGYADKTGRWPRTQEMLRTIARNWEADARREDQWAEQRKMKF